MDDRLEDMMCDIGEDSFKRDHMYVTLYSDKEECWYDYDFVVCHLVINYVIFLLIEYTLE